MFALTWLWSHKCTVHMHTPLFTLQVIVNRERAWFICIC